MKFCYLPSEGRNVHWVGGKAHPERHGRLHAQEPGNQLLQLLVNIQVPWWPRETPSQRSSRATCKTLLQILPSTLWYTVIETQLLMWQLMQICPSECAVWFSNVLKKIKERAWLEKAKCYHLYKLLFSSLKKQEVRGLGEMVKRHHDGQKHNFSFPPSCLPISQRVLPTPAPYFCVVSTAASAQAPVFSAKPR